MGHRAMLLYKLRSTSALYRRMQVMVRFTIPGLSLIHPDHFNQQFSHLHVVPGIEEPTQGSVLYIFIGNFTAKPLHLPKRVTIAHGTPPSPLIINLPERPADHITNVYPDIHLLHATIPAPRYRPAKDREAHMSQHVVVESTDFQHLAKDWK